MQKSHFQETFPASFRTVCSCVCEESGTSLTRPNCKHVLPRQRVPSRPSAMLATAGIGPCAEKINQREAFARLRQNPCAAAARRGCDHPGEQAFARDFLQSISDSMMHLLMCLGFADPSVNPADTSGGKHKLPRIGRWCPIDMELSNL